VEDGRIPVSEESFLGGSGDADLTDLTDAAVDARRNAVKDRSNSGGTGRADALEK